MMDFNCDSDIILFMFKLKRHNKIHNFHCTTQPDEIPYDTSHKLDTLDPQQRLFQISLKANQQQFAETFTVWSKQIAKTQTINLLSPIDFQEGCLNKTLSNLKTNIVMLNKKQFQLKKWKDKKYRESELKKSILSNQRKKSCIPINFNLQNYDNKKYTSRIHSRTYSTSFYTPNQTCQENMRCKSQIRCDLDVTSKQDKKEREKLVKVQKDSKILQNQLVIHKKKAKTLRQTIDTDQEQSTFRQNSYSKHFNILNSLIQQQKKKVLFPLKRLSPTSKLKGIFQKRRHSVNK